MALPPHEYLISKIKMALKMLQLFINIIIPNMKLISHTVVEKLHFKFFTLSPAYSLICINMHEIRNKNNRVHHWTIGYHCTKFQLKLTLLLEIPCLQAGVTHAHTHIHQVECIGSFAFSIGTKKTHIHRHTRQVTIIMLKT